MYRSQQSVRVIAGLLLLLLIALAPTETAAQRVPKPDPPTDSQPGSQPLREQALHWVPTEGTAHPVFATAGKEDTIEVYLSFGFPTHPGPNLASRLTPTLSRWRKETIRATEVKPVIDIKVHRRSLMVVISGIELPMAIVDGLVKTFRDSALPLTEVFLLRRDSEAAGGRGIPISDPRMPEPTDYADADAYWQAVFDPEQPSPASEDTGNMLALITFEDGAVVYEVRGMPLFFDDLRLAYGTPKVDVIESDGRSLEVAEVLKRNLFYAFPQRAQPTFIDTEGNPNRVIKIKRGLRVGYSFAIRREGKKISPFVLRYPEGFRYREYELLAGIRAAVKEMDLEPVILWSRGSLYIINIWERMVTD